ncbi:MAG TPA: hypothetical protein VIG33_09915 [Pseudobdellovibrionaceae bacterium]
MKTTKHPKRRLQFVLLLFLQIIFLSELRADFSPVRSPEAIHFHHLPVEAIQDPLAKSLFGLCPSVISQQTSECFNPILDSGHPVLQHARTWIAYLDKVLRTRFPDEMVNVPTPYVVLSPSSDFNAAALGTERCYQIAVRPGFESKSVSSPSREEMIEGASWEIVAPGMIAFDKKLEAIRCESMTLPGKEQELRRELEYFNSGSKNGCQLQLENGELFYNEKCLTNASLTNAFESSVFRVSVSGDAFKINLGAYANSVTEESFIAVLTHELGHYYRQHADALLPLIAYYYSGRDARQKGRPVPRSEFNTLASRFFKYETYPVSVPPFPGQTLHPILYSVFQLAEPGNCRKGDQKCQKLCDKSWKFLARDIFENEGASYPQSLDKPSSAFSNAVLKAEKMVLNCAQEIAMSDEVLRSINLQMNTLDAYWYTENNLQKIKANTLAEWYFQISSSLRKLDEDWTKLFSQSLEIQLGFYTEEQEADEFAAHLLTFAGLSPHLEAQIYLDQFDFASSRNRLELNSLACLAAKNHQWQSWVPIGSMTEHHHSPCFRAYNIEQLIHRENLIQATGMHPPRVSKEKWAALREIARTQGK